MNEIDLLRFIAAMSVVLFHYGFRGHAADALSAMPYPLLAPAAKYGYLGVELFFMISGFVILMTAAAGNVRQFVTSRVVRLYPAFLACCALTYALTLMIGAPVFAVTPRTFLYNLTMFAGFFDIPNVDGSYWSLFVEIRFYALVAVVLLARQIHRAELLLGAWLAASIGLEFVHVGRLSVLLITEYSAYFIGGAVCFLVWRDGPSLSRAAMIAGSWMLAIRQSVAPLGEIGRRYGSPMSPLVVSAAVTACFAVMLLVAVRRTGAIGRRQWLVAGAVTYPLYLLHQNIGFMLFNAAYPAVNAHLLMWGTVVGVIGIAYAVHQFVERPSASGLKRLFERRAELESRTMPRGLRNQGNVAQVCEP